jgi:hypothetical protein
MTDYYTKYLKYKNKYLNLKNSNIYTSSRNSDNLELSSKLSEHSNKNKYINLRLNNLNLFDAIKQYKYIGLQKAGMPPKQIPRTVAPAASFAAQAAEAAEAAEATTHASTQASAEAAAQAVARVEDFKGLTPNDITSILEILGNITDINDIFSLVETNTFFYNIYHNPSILNSLINIFKEKYPEESFIWDSPTMIIYIGRNETDINYRGKDTDGKLSYKNFKKGVLKMNWRLLFKYSGFIYELFKLTDQNLADMIRLKKAGFNDFDSLTGARLLNPEQINNMLRLKQAGFRDVYCLDGPLNLNSKQIDKIL